MRLFRSISLVVVLIKIVLISICATQSTFDVTQYGADLKGVNKSTDAIKKAIDAAVDQGGGTVYFPKGEYLTGPIRLASDITLKFEDSSLIRFSNDFDDFLPMVKAWWGQELVNFSPLIYAVNTTNIVIEGKAILEGQGSYWWDYWKNLTAEYNKTGETNTKYQKEFFRVNNSTEFKKQMENNTALKVGFIRTHFIEVYESKNIVIKDITVRNSPLFNLYLVFCQNITIKDVTIFAPNNSKSTDGIDPHSCKDVIIDNVDIDVGDDNIALKSSVKDSEGRGGPTENVLITNSRMYHGHGLSIGSQVAGGVRNVTVTNCVFNGTNRGLYVKSVGRAKGGTVQDIHYSNISMTNIVYEAIGLTMYYNNATTANLCQNDCKNINYTHSEPFTANTSVYRDFYYTNITGDPNTSIFLVGLVESPIENVIFKNVTIVSKNNITQHNTKNVKIN